MIEPLGSPRSHVVFKNFHHEPFDPEAKDWSLASGGPLSGANGAIPWILLVRDREKFTSRFPELSVEIIRPCLPFRYLVSGGVSMRSLMPGFTHGIWAGLERLLESQMSHLGMFAFIALGRR